MTPTRSVHRPRTHLGWTYQRDVGPGRSGSTTMSQIDWAPANEPDNIRLIEDIAPLEQALTGGTPQRVGGRER